MIAVAVSKHVKDLDLKAFHNNTRLITSLGRVSKHVKDLDLKAFHNWFALDQCGQWVSKHVKDLDLKAFHNWLLVLIAVVIGIKARQRS